MGIDFNKINSAATYAAKHAEQIQRMINQQSILENDKRYLQDLVVKNPVVDQMSTLIDNIDEQNDILREQVKLLTEENERQKAQIEEVKIAEKEAKAEARKSKIFGWISFGVATAISIAALVVSIVK